MKLKIHELLLNVSGGRRGEVQWTRDNFGLGVDRELAGFHRYNMAGGGEEEGDYSLHIDAVTAQDDAT